MNSYLKVKFTYNLHIAYGVKFLEFYVWGHMLKNMVLPRFPRFISCYNLLYCLKSRLLEMWRNNN